jgi:hypothetical protein
MALPVIRMGPCRRPSLVACQEERLDLRRNRRPPLPPLRPHPTRAHPPRRPPMMKPCLDCGHPAERERCQPCATSHDRNRYATQTATRKARGGRPQYDGAHRKIAGGVRATAVRCWICHEPAKPNDPWQADHIIPASKIGGGGAGLAPAHRSCNIRRSNKLRAGKPDIALTNTTKQKGAGGRQPPQHTTTAHDNQTHPKTERTST